jgi:hypothetical protein
MKFTQAVLIGAVAAHPLVEKAKHMCPFQHWLERHHLSHPVKKCEGRDESQMMTHHTFMRKLIYNVLNSFIKGFYDDKREHPLDQRCRGDWMEEDHKKVHDIFHRLFHDGDIWGVSHAELKSTTDLAWDSLFKNIEYCGFYRMAHNQYEYSMTNWKDAMYHVDMADRLYDNLFRIAMLMMEEFHLMMKKNDCQTDEQMLGGISEFVEKFAELKKIEHGFEGKWDQHAKLDDKLTFKEMWHNYHNFKKEHTNDLHHECPMKALWKKIFGDYTPEDFIGDIMKLAPTMPHFSLPHHMTHHQSHHNTHHSAWGFPSLPSFEPKHITHHIQHHMNPFEMFKMPQMQREEMPNMANPFASFGVSPFQVPHMPMQMSSFQMPHLF